MELYIDTNNTCNLRCRWCVRCLGMVENSNDVMDIVLFEEIIKKSKNCSFKRICLYGWAEPFLNRKLASYVEVVTKYGYVCKKPLGVRQSISD